jgi:hypothetical protein
MTEHTDHTLRECLDADLPVVITDEEDDSKIVARFRTLREADHWLDGALDQEKVNRGGYGIDAPEGMAEAWDTRKP